MSRKTLFIALSGFTLAACSGADRAKAQASQDFHCPQIEIDVKDIGNDRYEVNACQNFVVYRCAENKDKKKVCVRDDK